MVEVDKLEDLIGRHQLNSHRFGSYVKNRINKLLERSDARLTAQISELLDGLTAKEVELLVSGNYTTKRLIALRDSLNELQAAINTSVLNVLDSDGREYAGYEVRRGAQVAYASGVDDIGTKISTSQAYAAAMARPMQGRFIRDYVRDLSSNHKKEIRAAITEGYVLGENLQTIMSRIKGTTAAKRSDGLLYKRNGMIERLIVRNSLTHISAVAQMEAFKQLEVNEYYLSPVFDGRTSKICASLNSSGLKYYKVGSGLLPPLHPGGCRTIALPKQMGKSSIEKPFIADTRPLSKIPKADRADVIGKTKATSFEGFLKRQDAGFQREWLGAARYKLWKEGIPLSGFADPRKGLVYNLAELEDKNKAAFTAAGL